MAARHAIPRLLLVTDAARARLPLLDVVEEAVIGGVDGIYLRGGWGAGDALAGIAPTAEIVRELRARIGEEIPLLVNGGVMTARKLGTGLHLRERDPLPTLSTVAERPPLLGRSVHSAGSAAASIGMDYVLAGHVYPSASKPGRPPLGLDRFAAIAAAAPCPALAIGGITAERVAEIIHAGAWGIAVIGAIVEADDPRAAASALRRAVDRALQSRQEERAVAGQMSGADDAPAFDIVVNGKTVAIVAGDTVHDFLASKRMTDAMAIVERNGEIVPRADYGATALAPGDRLEIVHAVGGG